MSGRIRRIGPAIAGALLITTTLVVVTMPAGAQQAPGFDCSTAKVRVLFFPEGHGKVKAAKLPRSDAAEALVYRGSGKKFKTSAQIAKVNAGTALVTDQSCTLGSLTATTGTATEKTSERTRLNCTFDANVLLSNTATSDGGYQVVGFVNGSAKFFAQISGSTATLNYDPNVCTVKKVPK